jgi:hypothetical protein
MGDRGADLVETSLNAEPGAVRCRQCGGDLTRRPRGLRDARFCQPGCRAKWHQAKRTALFAELAAALACAASIVRELREGQKP